MDKIIQLNILTTDKFGIGLFIKSYIMRYVGLISYFYPISSLNISSC